MSNLSAFMRANVEQIENHKFAASPRIKGENGKPMEWEICCISADEYARIRSACIRQVPVPGKKGQYTQQLDTYTFQAKVAARCTVFPDLNNAALQNDWGVAKPEELIGKLLIGGEFDDYVTEVFQVNGFKTDDDMVAEDIVAESLVKYWRLVSAGENEITEALLLTILKNKALNYLRHKAIHDAAIENLEEIKNRELSIRISTLEACDPKEIFSDEVNRIIHKTLKNLPEQTHRIFEMSRFENKTVKEIADETNLTIKGVEYHITKALKALRINLKDYLPLFYFLFS